MNFLFCQHKPGHFETKTTMHFHFSDNEGNKRTKKLSKNDCVELKASSFRKIFANHVKI